MTNIRNLKGGVLIPFFILFLSFLVVSISADIGSFCTSSYQCSSGEYCNPNINRCAIEGVSTLVAYAIAIGISLAISIGISLCCVHCAGCPYYRRPIRRIVPMA